MIKESVKSGDYKTELEKYGAIAFVPKGNSMWPTLTNRGQSVIVEKKSEKLKKYDVALYTRGEDKFVLHRVMEPTEWGYIMCGDSQFDLEKVREDRVFGVMCGFYRGREYVDCTDPEYIRYVQNWFARKFRRKLRIKIFYAGLRIKGIIRRIFKGKAKKEEENV